MNNDKNDPNDADASFDDVEPAEDTREEEESDAAATEEVVTDELAVVEASEDLADDSEPAALEESAAEPKRSSAGVLAVVFSLAALAGVVFLYLTRPTLTLPDMDFASPSDVAAIRSQQDELRASIAALQNSVDAFANVGDDSADSRERLAASLRADIRALEQRLGNYDSLPPRVGNLENAVERIQGIEAGARDALLLAEAEYYLQTANTLASLAGNVELAAIALGMADDRLASIGNPALNNVRQALSDEQTALEGTPTVDVESNAIVLSSLAQLVDSLPLKPLDAQGSAVTADEAESGGAWNAIKEAMGDIVKVTPPTDDSAPLLLPGTEPLIHSNLSLQLQAARLALLTGEQAIFEQSLDDADGWLLAYFDNESLQVQSARETLAEIRSLDLTRNVPDISESLRLLRQYQSLAGSES